MSSKTIAKSQYFLKKLLRSKIIRSLDSQFTFVKKYSTKIVISNVLKKTSLYKKRYVLQTSIDNEQKRNDIEVNNDRHCLR